MAAKYRSAVETITASTVVTPAGVLAPGELSFEDGLIVDVRSTRGPVPDRVLCPGFVDLQVNGHDDVHVSAADGGDWDRLDSLLTGQGVTAWCPTITTAPLASIDTTLTRIAAAAARPTLGPAILGAHLEGPFLGGAPGAHPPEHLRAFDRAWLDALPAIVRVITLAPELDGAIEMITTLASRKTLVSLGHSTATYEQALAGATAGARLVTHLFNGMGPLHHRQPGLVGATLADQRLTPSLIADGVHVHPAALRAAARAKGPGGWILVTDAVGWRDERVGGRLHSLVDGAPRLADGILAGSATTMDASIARMVRDADIGLVEVVHAAATTPARLLGLEGERGALAPGLRADIVALDPDTLRATDVWIGGLPAR